MLKSNNIRNLGHSINEYEYRWLFQICMDILSRYRCTDIQNIFLGWHYYKALILPPSVLVTSLVNEGLSKSSLTSLFSLLLLLLFTISVYISGFAWHMSVSQTMSCWALLNQNIWWFLPPTDWVQIEYEYFKTRGHSWSGSQQQLAMFIVIAEERFVILRNY